MSSLRKKFNRKPSRGTSLDAVAAEGLQVQALSGMDEEGSFVLTRVGLNADADAHAHHGVDGDGEAHSSDSGSSYVEDEGDEDSRDSSSSSSVSGSGPRFGGGGVVGGGDGTDGTGTATPTAAAGGRREAAAGGGAMMEREVSAGYDGAGKRAAKVKKTLSNVTRLLKKRSMGGSEALTVGRLVVAHGDDEDDGEGARSHTAGWGNRTASPDHSARYVVWCGVVWCHFVYCFTPCCARVVSSVSSHFLSCRLVSYLLHLTGGGTAYRQQYLSMFHVRFRVCLDGLEV